ncbi:MAG: hypothetical protein HY291_04010 [Planctomycetes bacterium]|nr:hypothetical protein [Planctomycetota bacterium]
MSEPNDRLIAKLSYASIAAVLAFMAGLWFSVPRLQTIAINHLMDLPFATRLVLGLGVWERRYGAIVLGLWILAAYAAMKWHSRLLAALLFSFSVLAIFGAFAALLPPFMPYL